jgi:hypothetical protein
VTTEQPLAVTQEDFERAAKEVARLQVELDITNADHVALWIEHNTIGDEPMNQCASWLACRIVEAHEIEMAKARLASRPDTNTVADELEALTKSATIGPNEIGLLLPSGLRDRILASLRQSPAPDDKAANKAGGLWYRRWFKSAVERNELRDELTRTAALLKEAREVIEPFAKWAGRVPDGAPDALVICSTMNDPGGPYGIATALDFRRARQFLDNLDKGGSQ